MRFSASFSGAAGRIVLKVGDSWAAYAGRACVRIQSCVSFSGNVEKIRP